MARFVEFSNGQASRQAFLQFWCSRNVALRLDRYTSHSGLNHLCQIIRKVTLQETARNDLRSLAIHFQKPHLELTCSLWKP